MGLALNSFVWAWLKTPSMILHNFIYLAERMVTQTIVKFICFFSLETWWPFLFLFSSPLYTFTLNSLTVCVHTHVCVYWYTESQMPFLFPLRNWIENVIRLCFEILALNHWPQRDWCLESWKSFIRLNSISLQLGTALYHKYLSCKCLQLTR